MPNYNKSKHVSKAIESVQAQSLGDFELLVVDDASTDDSPQIVEEKSKGDSRVSLVEQPIRRGASHCRNVGIQHSRAKTIAFLDSDDVYAPGALMTMSRALEIPPSPGVVYSDYWLLDGSDRTLPRWPRSCTRSGMIFKELLVNEMPVQANLMIPREVIDKVGLFDESISWGEDTDMIFRLAQIYPFKYVDEQLYGYRLYEGNTWNRMSNWQRQAMKAPIIERYFRANIRALDRETRRIVDRQLVERYLESRRYRKAMAIAASSPGLFVQYLRLVRKRLFSKTFREGV